MFQRFLLVSGSAVLLLVITGCGSKPTDKADPSSYVSRSTKVQVEVARAQRGPFSIEVELTGNLLPRRIARVMPEVDGLVRSIPRVGPKFDVEINGRQYSEQLGITLGQAVNKGDVLVELDKRDFELSLRMALAKLSKAGLIWQSSKLGNVPKKSNV